MAANKLVENNEGQEKQQQKKPFLNKVFIIGAGIALIISVIAGILLFISARQAPGSAQDQAILYELGEFTTNLAPDGNKRFVQVKIILELEQAVLDKEVTEKAPILHDCILVFFNSKNSGDLLAENRDQLKKELLNQMNACLQDGKITNIYFSTLVIQ